MGQLYSTLPGTQGMPGSVYVCIEVFLRWLSSADTVARVVIGKDVAVDTSAKTNVETAHLPQVDSISMGEEDCKSERTHIHKTG